LSICKTSIDAQRQISRLRNSKQGSKVAVKQWSRHLTKVRAYLFSLALRSLRVSTICSLTSTFGRRNNLDSGNIIGKRSNLGSGDTHRRLIFHLIVGHCKGLHGLSRILHMLLQE